MISQSLHPIVPTIVVADSMIHEALRTIQDCPELLTPSDIQIYAKVVEVTAHIKSLKPTMMVLVGIGGSNMGTLALVQALRGVFFHELPLEMSFYCADTIDNDFDNALLKRAEKELLSGGSFILCLVTKSGTTTESLINGSLFLRLLKVARPHDYQNYVVIITDEASPLAQVAQEQKFSLLTIPTLVGGRFSVFTAVSLFPLALLGIDIEEFCRGARASHAASLHDNLAQNPAAHSAAFLYAHYKAGFAIYNLFVFRPDLFMLGNWYKQLIGESLGKKYDLEHKQVDEGFTPLVSVGLIDLHSAMQRYLAGPRTIVTSFIDVADENEDLKVPVNEISDLIPGLKSHSITSIKRAIKQGVIEAYKEEKLPYMVIHLPSLTSYFLGQFMMMKMIETILLARLLNINPFDQPAVELYKKKAHEIFYSGNSENQH